MVRAPTLAMLAPLIAAATPSGRGDVLPVAVAAWRKARQNRAILRHVLRDLSALVRLVRAWASGEYKQVSWRSIALAATALAYFLNPGDLIPDPIAFAGYIDDATVIGFVASSLRDDILRFRRWELERAQPAKPREDHREPVNAL